MYYHIIASGSKGNATLIVSGSNMLLIDLGITKTRLIEGLSEINKTIKDISACLITHDHTDHISGIRFVSPSITYGLLGVVPSLGHEISLYKPIQIGVFKITPIKTSHDATDSCGYVIEDGQDKLVYITDTGIILDEIYEYTYNPTYLIIESNHNIKMLLKTHRPIECKHRIMSEVGHLCNEDSAFASLKMIGEATKDIVLAHISEEANSPEVAIKTYQRIFMNNHIDISKYNLICAPQWKSYTGGDYVN